MNDEVVNKADDVLASLLEKTVGAVERGADWLAGEIPDVVNQLLAWHFWQSCILAFIFLILCVAVVIGYIKLWKLVENEFDPSIIRIGDGVVATMLLCFLGSSCILTALNALKIAIAPKLYLLEYASSLVK